MIISFIGVSILAFTLGMFTFFIFKDFWFTPYGAKLPFKKVRFKWSLLIPMPLIGVGLTSFLTTGWTNPFDITWKICFLAIIIPAAYQLYHWHKTTCVYDVPLDVAVRNRFPNARRLNETEYQLHDDIFSPTFEAGDVYIIPEGESNEFARLFADYLRYNDHLIQPPPFELLNLSAKGRDLEVTAFLSRGKEGFWQNRIYHNPRTGYVVFQGNLHLNS